MARPTDAEVTAAARVLFERGVEHGWWPKGLPRRLEELDPIGREEFEALVEEVLIAARAARPRTRVAPPSGPLLSREVKWWPRGSTKSEFDEDGTPGGGPKLGTLDGLPQLPLKKKRRRV